MAHAGEGQVARSRQQGTAGVSVGAVFPPAHISWRMYPVFKRPMAAELLQHRSGRHVGMAGHKGVLLYGPLRGAGTLPIVQTQPHGADPLPAPFRRESGAEVCCRYQPPFLIFQPSMSLVPWGHIQRRPPPLQPLLQALSRCCLADQVTAAAGMAAGGPVGGGKDRFRDPVVHHRLDLRLIALHQPQIGPALRLYGSGHLGVESSRIDREHAALERHLGQQGQQGGALVARDGFALGEHAPQVVTDQGNQMAPRQVISLAAAQSFAIGADAPDRVAQELFDPGAHAAVNLIRIEPREQAAHGLIPNPVDYL